MSFVERFIIIGKFYLRYNFDGMDHIKDGINNVIRDVKKMEGEGIVVELLDCLVRHINLEFGLEWIRRAFMENFLNNDVELMDYQEFVIMRTLAPVVWNMDLLHVNLFRRFEDEYMVKHNIEDYKDRLGKIDLEVNSFLEEFRVSYENWRSSP